jgi:hypothetical protein
MRSRGGSDRAQATQVGVVILLGFLVVAFAGYQAFVLPEQNRAVEFDHFEGTQNDMESVRNAVLEAETASNEVPTEVKLGANYPARSFAIQPPGSTGSLRSARIGDGANEATLSDTDADLTDICGSRDGSTTLRRLTYDPEYNRLQGVGAVTYENTVTYTTGSDGGRVFHTDQSIVDGERISLYPLVGAVNESGRGLTSLTFTGGVTGRNGSVSGPFNLTLPTRLSAEEWSDLLGGEPNVDDVRDVPGTDAVEIQFAGGTTYDISCTPVGSDGAPDNDPTVSTGGGDGDSSGGGAVINPNFGDDVVLTDLDETGGTDQVTLTLNNTASDRVNVTGLRFPFFNANSQSGSGSELPVNFSYDGTTVERLGGAETVPTVTLGPGQKELFTLRFNCVSGDPYDLAGGDFFVLTVFFEDGESTQYFVALADSGKANNRC